MLRSDASGNANTLLFPSIALSAWSPKGSYVSGDTVYCSSPPAAIGSGAHGLVAVGNGFGFDLFGLQNHFVRYRIVGWGVRVRGLAPLMTGSGEIVAAPLAAKGMVPWTGNQIPQYIDSDGGTRLAGITYGAKSPTNTAAQYLRAMGAPYSGSDNDVDISAGETVRLPKHGTASYSQVTQRGLHMRSFPFEPEAHEFKPINNYSVGTDSFDSYNVDVASITTANASDLGAWRLGGWESMVLAASGLPASTDSLQVEVIYHLEATVNPNLYTYRASCQPSPYEPHEYEQTRRALTNTPSVSFADVVQTAQDSLLGAVEGQVSKFASSAVDSLAGMLGRMIANG